MEVVSGLVFVFAAYLLFTFGLGLYQARRTRTQSDFVLGGSRLPGWMLALSERATGESAWLLLGFTGYVYASGLSAVWIGVGCLAGIVTAWTLLAQQFRREAARFGALTMPEYLAARFPEQSGPLRILSTVIIVFFFVFYVGAQFAGAGKTIQQTFGIDPFWGQLIAVAVILSYATAGGFISVVAVDAFQALLMITTLLVTPALLFLVGEGAHSSLASALAASGSSADSWTGGLSGFAAGLLIFNHLAWYFGYLGGQPQLNARFMAMPDDHHLRSGRRLAVGWTLAAYGGAVFIGLGALRQFGSGAVPDPEMILPFVVTQLFPWWLAGVLLAGVVAAMISTAESMLLVAASSVSQDVYQGLLRKGKASDRALLRVSRGATLGVGILGFVLALTTEDLIYTIVSYAWAGIGCSFSPTVLLTFYWGRFSGRGAVACLTAGLLTTIVWIGMGWEQIITARAVTFFVALLAGWLFGRSSPEGES